jgi:hypothetical protein
MSAVLEFRFHSCRAPAFRRLVPPRGPERLRRARPTAGSRAGNSAPGHSFTVVRFIFTALPLLTGPKGTPANILLRSAMVLSGRAAQDMEAGSSSFPGVGASGLNLRQPEGMVAPKIEATGAAFIRRD